tara:strand:- start:1123 stop:1332 length:210 start_codon:yes stop_codon:yes gene_type:complete
MMNKEINSLIAKLNYYSEEDITEQLEVSVKLIRILLVEVDHLQSFALEHGLDGDDFAEYIDDLDKVTIH